ncbi:lasso peptide biosynthesis B2 protein [Affinibrenneria salicis]|nr:lasso peptide biosynthesis B2 protein [Affinibrenneria salicis]
MLDVIKDEYTIIKKNNSIDGLLNSASEYLWNLEKCGLEKKSNYLISSECNEFNYNGYLEERWMISQPQKKSGLKIDIIISILELYFLIKQIKNCGLIGVVSGLEKVRRKNKKYAVDKQLIIDKYKTYLIKIFPLISKKSNCLSYSFFLASKLNQHGVPAVLVIGVRTQPFYSHAWVELDGVVINDDPKLREKLSVILVI